MNAHKLWKERERLKVLSQLKSKRTFFRLAIDQQWNVDRPSLMVVGMGACLNLLVVLKGCELSLMNKLAHTLKSREK